MTKGGKRWVERVRRGKETRRGGGEEERRNRGEEGWSGVKEGKMREMGWVRGGKS